MQAVLIAGGRGTRLAPLTDTIPKPMLPVNGRPFLEYELELLKRSGISDFVLCVGYLGHIIQDHFGNGSKLGISISYSFDREEPLGVIGALKRAEPLLEDSFFMTYGDCYLRADYRNAMLEFRKSKKLGMMFVFENRNKYGRSDVQVSEGYVANYDKKVQTPDMTFINYGLIALRKESLKRVPKDEEFGEQEFFGQLIKDHELLARVVDERFYEIGTKESLKEFEKFISQQRIVSKDI